MPDLNVLAILLATVVAFVGTGAYCAALAARPPRDRRVRCGGDSRVAPAPRALINRR